MTIPPCSPVIRLICYGIVGFIAIIAACFYASQSRWDIATFALVASFLADFHFNVALNETNKK